MKSKLIKTILPRSFRQERTFGESGSGILEWAIALPFIFVLIVGIMDFMRFQGARYIAQRGAMDGVHAATRIHGMQFDVRGLPDGDKRYDDYVRGRSKSIDAAVELAKNTWFETDSEDASVRLLPVKLSAAGDPNFDAAETVNAVVLRPGERYTLMRSNGETEIVEHPTLCAPNPPDATKCADVMQPTDNYEDVLLHHPIVVYVYGEVQPLLPMLPTMEVKGFSMGFREQIRRGLYPDKPRLSFREAPTTTTTTTTQPECLPPWVACPEEVLGAMTAECRVRPQGNPNCVVESDGQGCCRCTGAPRFSCSF